MNTAFMHTANTGDAVHRLDG